MFYPQNGDRIVTIDSVTSLHPMYSIRSIKLLNYDETCLLVKHQRMIERWPLRSSCRSCSYVAS